MPPIGDQACETMPCAASASSTSVWRKYGCTSTWLDRGHDGRALEQAVEVCGHEVAHADRADAVGEQLLERPVRVGDRVEGGWDRLVEDEQVEPVDAELAGALVERVQGLVVAVVADPPPSR